MATDDPKYDIIRGEDGFPRAEPKAKPEEPKEPVFTSAQVERAKAALAENKEYRRIHDLPELEPDTVRHAIDEWGDEALDRLSDMAESHTEHLKSLPTKIHGLEPEQAQALSTIVSQVPGNAASTAAEPNSEWAKVQRAVHGAKSSDDFYANLRAQGVPVVDSPQYEAIPAEQLFAHKMTSLTEQAFNTSLSYVRHPDEEGREVT